MQKTEAKFKGYKATFTNSATGKTYPCFVVNVGSGNDKVTGEKTPALKIQINEAIGQTNHGSIIRKYGPAKWVKASSVK